MKAMRLTKVSDSGDARIGEATYKEKIQKINLMSVYGIVSVPPVGSFVAGFCQDGQSSNLIGFADKVKERKKLTKEYEVALTNYKTKAFVLMRDDGCIQIDTNGDVEVRASGSLTADIAGPATIKASAVTIDTPEATFTGKIIAEEIETESCVVDGVEVAGHTHTDPQGGSVGVME